MNETEKKQHLFIDSAKLVKSVSVDVMQIMLRR